MIQDSDARAERAIRASAELFEERALLALQSAIIRRDTRQLVWELRALRVTSASTRGDERIRRF
jgi:hypothetical protein